MNRAETYSPNRPEHPPAIEKITEPMPEEGKVWTLAEEVDKGIKNGEDTVDHLEIEQKQQLQELQEMASSLGIPELQWEEILVQHQVNPILEKLNKGARKLLNKLRKSMLVGLGAYIFLFPGAGILGRGKDVTDIFETSPLKKMEQKIPVEMIRQSVFNDKKEWSFLATNLDGENYYQSSNEGQQARVRGADVDIDNFINTQALRPEIKEIRFAHTHPLTAYQYLRIFGSANFDSNLKPVEYDFSEIEKFKNGQLNLPPLPPSSTDIQTLIGRNLIHQDKDLSIRFQVYEPTGKWDFTVDHQHSFMQSLKSIYEEEASIQEQFLNSFTEEEKIKITDLAGVFKLDPDFLISVAKTNNFALSKVRKYETALEALNVKSDPLLDKIASIELSAHSLRMARQSSPEQIQKLIDEYVQICQTIGVNMHYAPSLS